MSNNNAKIGVGVNAWVWTSPFANDSLELITRAAEMGFDAFTVPLENLDDFDTASLKSAMGDTGMRFYVTGAYGPDRDLANESPQVRQQSLDYIKAAVELCEQLGIHTLVGPAYSAVGKRRKIPDEQRKQEWDWAVSGLTQAGKIAADHGVTLAIEPLNRFETDLVNTAEQVKRMIGEINLPSVKIHLDTFHMHIEEKNVYDAIVLAGDDLVYVDASESDRGTPGKGQVHWNEVARALGDINYKGDCIIESFTPDCEMIADAAAIWRPLAESQDALASDGCQFLKSLL